MPELPEVEIIKQSLNEKIKGQIVKRIIVKNRNLRFKVPKNFEKVLKNQKIIKIGRFSKYLIVFLSNKNICLIHLGMSGTIHLIKKNCNNSITNTSFYHSLLLPKRHNHIEIFFKKFKLVYNDPRRFGFFEILKNSKLLKKRFCNMGPEPFDRRFNLNYIYLKLRGKEKRIKDFLLDQRFISGVGNIYANEILYLSKIKPDKKAKYLKIQEYKKILSNSKLVLLKAIKKGGSSIRDFKNTSGKTGNFQKEFQVYQRDGMSCKRHGCKGIIKKKDISKRSSFFCSFCQK